MLERVGASSPSELLLLYVHMYVHGASLWSMQLGELSDVA